MESPDTFITLDIQGDNKLALLRQLGLETASPLRIAPRKESLDSLLQACRVHCLSKEESYFLQSPGELRRPLNLRNEAAAVSLLLARLPPAAAALRRRLLEHGEGLWPEFSSGDVALSGREPPPAEYPPPESADGAFERWAAQRGVAAALRLASFGGLRGAAAARAIAPGDSVLSIPAAVLIYDDSIRGTDLGAMLAAVPGLDAENALILFTMVDRWDGDSGWAPYWASLPPAFRTGLSFPAPLVEALAGTAAHLELHRAQDHLRAQYAATRPLLDMLLRAYPAALRAEWLTFEAYLWAAELWYSYAFMVEFPPPESKASGGGGAGGGEDADEEGAGADGGGGGGGGGSRDIKADKGSSGGPGGGEEEEEVVCKSVMVPFACHVNHSPWPHVVRYGRFNPATATLDYPAFRPCREGDQVYISYGAVQNLKLLVYYGFALPSNPHDQVPLTLTPPEGPLAGRQAAALAAAGLGAEHSLRAGPLAPALLAFLRVVVADEAELAALEEASRAGGAGGGGDPRSGPLGPENEAQALATLRCAVEGMVAELEACPLLPGGAAAAAEADALVAEVGGKWGDSIAACGAYVAGQLRILRHTLLLCDKLEAGEGGQAAPP